MPRLVASLLAWSLALPAFAEVDPACADIPKPDDYDEQVQGDFQANYFALSTSFSPIHAAIPHQGGHGSLGVDAKIIPPLSCEKRFVLDWTKTEDSNKTPILPQLRASYAFPAVLKDRLVFYASVAFFPSIPFNGTRNLVLSGEGGFGVHTHQFVDIGARYHTSMIRTYGDIATAFDPETEPVVEDVFMASTWGVDGLISFPIQVKKQTFTPFIAAGYLNASTFFLVGDSRYVANNLHPYAGVALSAGLDMLLASHLRLGGEFYAAPGGYSLPDKEATSVSQASRYGRIATARFRIGYEF